MYSTVVAVQPCNVATPSVKYSRVQTVQLEHTAVVCRSDRKRNTKVGIITIIINYKLVALSFMIRTSRIIILGGQ